MHFAENFCSWELWVFVVIEEIPKNIALCGKIKKSIVLYEPQSSSNDYIKNNK